MIARILLCLSLLLSALPATAKLDWTDIWYDPAESGWGVNMVQSDTFMFATFFIYGANGLPTWFTAQMNWVPSRLAYVGPLYTTTGTGYQFPWQPGNSSATQVGIASFTPTQGGFSVAYRGTLAYSFSANGLTITKSIQRQTLTAFDLDGSFTGGQYGEYYDCTVPGDNYSYTDPFDLEVVRLGNNLSLTFTYSSGFSCTLSGAVAQNGMLHRIDSASYRCSDGLSTTATVYELKSTGVGIEGRYFAPSVPPGCKEIAKFASVYSTGFAGE
jgi:hypothetical protein